MAVSFILTIKVHLTAKIKIPEINKLSLGIERPLWSVMIPTYNPTGFFRDALISVMDQDLGPEQMQIMVIDDCSPETDPEEIVNLIGKGRIEYYRQPKNLGLADNWNTCIEKAKGEWVHILHQDDLILSGFYECFTMDLSTQKEVGAAFCRHAFIDENNQWMSISQLQQESPGILHNWLTKMAIANQIQTASVVVRREVYESVGGYINAFKYALDWEMWIRIAAVFPFWYEPQVLACYRRHEKSMTSHLKNQGEDIRDVRLTLDYCKRYLPVGEREKLNRTAKEIYALGGLKQARDSLKRNYYRLAVIQIYQSLRCCTNKKTIVVLLKILIRTMLIKLSEPEII